VENFKDLCTNWRFEY